MEQTQLVSLSLRCLKRHKQAKMKHTPILAPALQVDSHSFTPVLLQRTALNPFHPSIFFTFNARCTIIKRKPI